MLNIFPYPDSLCYCLICICCCLCRCSWSRDREHTVQSRRSGSGLVGSLRGGATERRLGISCELPPSGVGRVLCCAVVCPTTTGSGTSEHPSPPENSHKCERSRPSSSVTIVHVIHRHGYVQRCYCQARVARFWQGYCHRCSFG